MQEEGRNPSWKWANVSRLQITQALSDLTTLSLLDKIPHTQALQICSGTVQKCAFPEVFPSCSALSETTKQSAWRSQGHSVKNKTQDCQHPLILTLHLFHNHFLFNLVRTTISPREEAADNFHIWRLGQQHLPFWAPASSMPLMYQDSFSSWWEDQDGTSPQQHHCSVKNLRLFKAELLVFFTYTFHWWSHYQSLLFLRLLLLG